MNIRWTSRLALTQELDKLQGLRLEVYSAIKAWDISKDGSGPTREQLAEKLGRKESSICGRVNELIKQGCVTVNTMVLNPKTGKSAESLIAYSYREESQQITVADDGQMEFFSSGQTSRNVNSGAFQ